MISVLPLELNISWDFKQNGTCIQVSFYFLSIDDTRDEHLAHLYVTLMNNKHC